MIAKHLQMLFYILLYFAGISLIGITLVESHAADSTIVIFIIGSIISCFPVFIFMGNRVFIWKAASSSAISRKEIEKRLSEFTVNGLTFSYEASSGAYLLSPFEYSISIMNRKEATKFYVKIWLDEINKKAKFCDYLIKTTTEHNLLSACFNAGKSHKKGMISLYTTAVSSDGNSFKFSTSAVHNELIELFTKHGWELQGKFF